MQFSRLYKVKEGKINIFKQWLAVLNGERKQEAVATFVHENITREVFVLFNGIDGDAYVAGLNEANGCIEKSDQAVAINQEHSEIKRECLESISEPGEILLDLAIRNN